MFRTCLAALLLIGCDGNDKDVKDSGNKPDPSELCNGGGECSVSIGTGSGGAFVAIEDGDDGLLESAPQGGQGVRVTVKTTGLVADGPVTVQLDTEVNGKLDGSFTENAVQLYCQDDGSGLFWDRVVGFDPDTDLSALEGNDADLVVTITDPEGNSCQGRVTINVVLQ